MRNFFLILLFIIPGLIKAQWTPHNVSVTTQTLRCISVPYDHIAWSSNCSPASTVIIKTTDGGLTWENVTTTTFNGRSAAVVCGVNENIAVVSTRDKVHRTTDGGNSWYEVFTPGGFVNAIQIDTTGYGILQGDPVGGTFSIWRTTNFGANWYRLPGPLAVIDHASTYNSLWFKDSTIWFCTNQYRVYSTTNLGTNWSIDTTVNWWPQPVWFNDYQTGMYAGPMTKTTNAGINWTQLSVPGVGGIYSITGYGNNWWYTRRYATVHASNDNGLTWSSDSLGAGVELHHISKSLRGTALYIAATDGMVFTSNGIISSNTNNHSTPVKFSLSQNYPNPFNPETKITFSIPVRSFVNLSVYDVNGHMISTLINKNLDVGVHSVVFNGAQLPSGVYFYRISSDQSSETKKMILLK